VDNRQKTIVTAVLALISSLTTGVTNGQEEVRSGIETAAEIIALSDDIESTYLLEKLSELAEQPVMINSGSEDEISRLFFLTEFQVKVLADYVMRNGDVLSVYELSLLPAFDRNIARLMEPYITLAPSGARDRHSRGRTMIMATAASRLSSVVDDERGTRSLLRLRHESNTLSYGLTAENDPGEPFTFKDAWGADFLSGHIMYSDNGFIRRVIIGDYALRFGEGLAYNTGSWQGAWLSSPSFMTGRSAVAPYTSTEENGFFRGAACLLGTLNSGAALFFSSNMSDARVIMGDDSSAVAVSNLVQGGVHVTTSSLEARNSLTETMAGIHLTAGGERVRGGVTTSVTWFSLPFLPDMSKPENVHSFTGSRLVNVAADLRAGTGPLLFFAEAASSFPGSWAATGGVRAKPSDRLSFNILARHLSPDYYAFHSGSFRAGSGSSGETGLAASVHLEVASHLFVSAGADHYRIPWPRYRSAAPSVGGRIEIKGDYLPRDDITLRLTYTSFSREYDRSSETGTAASEMTGKKQLAMLFSFNPSGNIRLTTRLSVCHTSPRHENGALLCQDLSIALRNLPLRIWFRYALCTSDSYDSRLYAWENDLIYLFSVPALYGECSRSSMMLSWKPADRLEFRAKYSLMSRKDELDRVVTGDIRVQGRIIF
jgi:hypothetical protein